MEEKNITKISLSTFFLILAVIVIIVMGIFIYKINNDKNTEIKKSTELQAQVSSLNGTVSELQEKINSISETINSSKEDIINNTNNSNLDETELSEDFIKNKFKTAWSIFKKSYDIFQYDSNDSIDLPVEGQNYTWTYYKITNYDDIVNKYISSSFSNLVDSMELIISKNNNYYIMDSTDGTSLNRIDEVTNIKKSNDKISCTVRIHLASYTGLDDESALEKKYEFELIKENDSWKISKFKLSK